jgi:uncharacterized protein with HEPN domain
MKNKLGDEQRLRHILNAIEEIEAYTHGVQKEDFLQNSMMRYASIKQLEIIGEACNHLSKEIREQSLTVQWNEIIGMRHVFVHEYFGIDNLLLWEIIKEDLMDFKTEVIHLLGNF